MRKHGFTLIEVLIALVIFVVGALAVIRIFPPAFHVVQNSGYSNVATRLSDSILSQMKGDRSTPKAVFNIDDSGSWASNVIEASWKDWEGSVIANNDQNYSLPQGASSTAYDASALNHFRFVRGESHDIQNSAGIDYASNAPYLLTNFPYKAPDNPGDVGKSGVHLYIDLKISGVTIDANGRLDFSDATFKVPFPLTFPNPGYSIRGANQSALITSKTANFHSPNSTYAFRPPELISYAGSFGTGSYSAILLFRSPIDTSSVNTGARFYVSYRYVVSGKTNSVINEPLAIPDDDTWNIDGGSSSGLDPANDTSDCDYVLQGLLAKKLLANKPVIVAGSVPVTMRAELLFIPSAIVPNMAGIRSNSTPLGTDQTLGNLGVVRLPPAFDDSSPANSLMPDTSILVDYLVPSWKTLFNESVTNSQNQVSLPITLLDPAFSVSGLVTNKNANLPAAAATPVSVDSTTGLVTYGVGDTDIRTVYQGLDGWATQISPSAESYVPFEESGTLAGYRSPGTPGSYFLPHEKWREYYWDPTLSAGIIYFHTSEAGKTVEVSFIPTGSTQPIKQILTIDKAIGNYGVPADYAATGYVARLQLKDVNGDAVDADGILGITGSGVIARTAWLNGSNYQQSVVAGYRNPD